jgi:hypothetical protein
MPWDQEIHDACVHFVAVAALSGQPLTLADISIELREAPHRAPMALPKGKMAVYGFWGDGVWLKIGMVGPNSNARYTYQHYTGKALSSLYGQLTQDAAMQKNAAFTNLGPKNWILTHCHRANLLLDTRHGRPMRVLLEAFLHARLKPRYEGR